MTLPSLYMRIFRELCWDECFGFSRSKVIITILSKILVSNRLYTFVCALVYIIVHLTLEEQDLVSCMAKSPRNIKYKDLSVRQININDATTNIDYTTVVRNLDSCLTYWHSYEIVVIKFSTSTTIKNDAFIMKGEALTIPDQLAVNQEQAVRTEGGVTRNSRLHRAERPADEGRNEYHAVWYQGEMYYPG